MESESKTDIAPDTGGPTSGLKAEAVKCNSANDYPSDVKDVP